MPVFFTTAQVAKALGVSRENVLGYIATGELKACNTSRGERKPRYKIRDIWLDAFIESRSTGPAAAAQPKRRKAKAETVPQYV